MTKEEMKAQLAEVAEEVAEELSDVPTREERTEATKWLGYEWDGILKFLRYLDKETDVVVPDEIRADYQNSLYEAKLEAVRRKTDTNSKGLIRPIR